MSEKIEFKVGDVVQLKSGGPKMTINHIAIWHDGDKEQSARCDWFDGKKMQQGVFILPALELA